MLRGRGSGTGPGVFWHRLGDRDCGRATARLRWGRGLGCVREERRLRRDYSLRMGEGGTAPRTVHLPLWSLLHAQARVSISSGWQRR